MAKFTGPLQLDIYVKVNASGRSEYFMTTARRNIDYVTNCLGCRPIDQPTSADAAKYGDWLVQKGLASRLVKGEQTLILKASKKPI